MNPRSVRRALAAGAFVVLAGGAVGACSLRDLGYLTSADGDDGGTKADARTTDARSHAEGGVVDAPRDAHRGDAGASKDAGHDVQPSRDSGPDATASHFCMGVDATFCEDFDEDPVTAGWTSVDQLGIDAGLAFLELSPDAWVSPPYSARIGADPLANSSEITTTSLNWSSDTPVHTLVVRVDVNVQAVSDTSSAVLYLSIGQPNLVISFCPGVGGSGCAKVGTHFGTVSEEFTQPNDAGCVSEAGAVYYQAPSCFIQYPLLAVPQKNVWATVEVSVSVDTQTMTMTVDGATSLPPTALPAGFWVAGSPAVSIGLGYAKGSSPLQSALYDNVVINAN
jgi:hypothetical protein